MVAGVMHPLSNTLLTPLEEYGTWGLSHGSMCRIFSLAGVELDLQQGIAVGGANAPVTLLVFFCMVAGFDASAI